MWKSPEQISTFPRVILDKEQPLHRRRGETRPPWGCASGLRRWHRRRGPRTRPTRGDENRRISRARVVPLLYSAAFVSARATGATSMLCSADSVLKDQRSGTRMHGTLWELSTRYQYAINRPAAIAATQDTSEIPPTTARRRSSPGESSRPPRACQAGEARTAAAFASPTAIAENLIHRKGLPRYSVACVASRPAPVTRARKRPQAATGTAIFVTERSGTLRHTPRSRRSR